MSYPRADQISGAVVISRIEALERAVDIALSQDSRADWATVWETIRSIGIKFRAAWFTSGEERRATWIRFQTVVGRVKESQQQAKHRHQVFQVRAEDSRRVAERIVTLARSAWPHEDGFIEFIGTITGAKLLAEVFVGLIELSVRVMSFGLFKTDARDDRFAFLQRCSRSLKQAWESYLEYRDIFITADRTAIREVLLRVQSELNEEWSKLKSERSGAEADRVKRKKALIAEIGSLPLLGPTAGEKSRELESLWKGIGYVGDKEVENRLWEEFRCALDEFWQERKHNGRERLTNALNATRANIEKLQASIEHDEGVLEEKQEKLANVFDGGRAEEIREHLQGVISNIEAKIERKRGWIKEQEGRIKDMEESGLSHE